MIEYQPAFYQFIPVIPPDRITEGIKEPVVLSQDEFEAIRLILYHKLTQEEAAKKMGISRGTVWRCLESARTKIAAMLVEGRPLVVVPNKL
jgi:predicted DNA-binding protein (UPF0251 family)